MTAVITFIVGFVLGCIFGAIPVYLHEIKILESYRKRLDGIQKMSEYYFGTGDMADEYCE